MLDIDHERLEFEAKLQKVRDDKDAYIEKAIDYEELLDVYGSKENINIDELEWDNNDYHGFRILENLEWIYEKIISSIDDIKTAGDDKDAIHLNNIGMDILVALIRGIKNESEAMIEREQELINEANNALEFLNLVREK